MLFSFIFAALIAYDICAAALPHVKCKREENYEKIGCFHTRLNGKDRPDLKDMRLMINDRDKNSPFHDGHILIWEEFVQSTHSLACRCAAKAKSKGLQYFSIQFYGECWVGKDFDALRSTIANEQWRSLECSNPDYTPCNDTHKTDCVGHANVDYIFKVEDNLTKVNGGFGPWTNYTACTKTCGGGVQLRTRRCNKPSPANGGMNCTSLGSSVETKICNTRSCTDCVFPFVYNGQKYYNCTNVEHTRLWCAFDAVYKSGRWKNCIPVNGGYGPWTNYTACTKTCGGGVQSRTRRCNKPSPANGGKNCTSLGPSVETQICNTRSCTDCVFPFVYNGQKYYNCTNVQHTRLWCAFDAVYKSGRWKNC